MSKIWLRSYSGINTVIFPRNSLDTLTGSTDAFDFKLLHSLFSNHLFYIPYFLIQFPRKLFFLEFGNLKVTVHKAKGHSTYICGNYSREETVRGNTVCLFICNFDLRIWCIRLLLVSWSLWKCRTWVLDGPRLLNSLAFLEGYWWWTWWCWWWWNRWFPPLPEKREVENIFNFKKNHEHGSCFQLFS